VPSSCWRADRDALLALIVTISMRRILLLAAALVIFALAGVALAPASLAGFALERATRGAVTFAGAEGTIWRGRGTLVAGSAQLPLGWTLDAWPLLRGQLRVHLEAPEGAIAAPRGVVALGPDGVELADVQVVFPAAMLATRARAFIRPAGDITLVSPALTWQPRIATGDTGIVWRNAQLVVAGGGAIALGTVTATLTAAGDRLAGPIVNEGGDVELGGDITLTAPAALDMSMTVHPRSGSESPLLRTLAAVATPDDGGWRVRWHGDLR
jgi:hypothetical protein